MKNALILIFSLICILAKAQDAPQQVMEQRARELHRVIGLDDKMQWKKFVEDNYSEAFINKAPSRKVMVEGEEQSSPSSQPAKTETEKVENKLGLMEMLHNDFGGSKLVSLKYSNHKVLMVLASNDGLRGTFTISYTKEKPNLIDNLGVEASR